MKLFRIAHNDQKVWVRYYKNSYEICKGLNTLGEDPYKWLENGRQVERDKKIQVREASLLEVPLPNSTSPFIYAIGLNYENHKKETKLIDFENKFPIVTAKAPTTVIGPSQNIRIDTNVCSFDEVDYEVELGIVIGKACKNVSAKDAKDFILGYTIVNGKRSDIQNIIRMRSNIFPKQNKNAIIILDVTARKWQGKTRGGGQWIRSKSFDTFCPIGPCISLDIENPHDLWLKTYLKKKNDSAFTLMQDSNTKNMIFNCYELVSFLSQGTTLPPW